MEFQVDIGARAVWVNAGTGECIGRFGVYGIDVHRTIADQYLGECLDCTHGRVTLADWTRFQRSMLAYHGVDISNVEVPSWINQ